MFYCTFISFVLCDDFLSLKEKAFFRVYIYKETALQTQGRLFPCLSQDFSVTFLDDRPFQGSVNCSTLQSGICYLHCPRWIYHLSDESFFSFLVYHHSSFTCNLQNFQNIMACQRFFLQFLSSTYKMLVTTRMSTKWCLSNFLALAWHTDPVCVANGCKTSIIHIAE